MGPDANADILILRGQGLTGGQCVVKHGHSGKAALLLTQLVKV